MTQRATVRVHAWARAAEPLGGRTRCGAEGAGQKLLRWRPGALPAPCPGGPRCRECPRSLICHRRSRPLAGRSPRAHPPPRSAARPAPAGGGSSRGKSRGWAGSGPWRRDPTPLPSRSAPRAVLPVPTLFMRGRNWDFPSACSAGRDLRAGLAGSGVGERARAAGAAGAAAASPEEDAHPRTGSRCGKGTMATAGEGMESAVGGPGDLPFPGSPASPVLPLHVQPLRHKFAFSRPGPIPPARDGIGP